MMKAKPGGSGLKNGSTTWKGLSSASFSSFKNTTGSFERALYERTSGENLQIRSMNGKRSAARAAPNGWQLLAASAALSLSLWHYIQHSASNLMQSLPTPAQQPRKYTAVILGYCLAVSLGALGWHLWPPSNPIHILEYRTYWNEAGHWVVETDARTDDVCVLTISRQFARGEDGPAVPFAPIAGQSLGGSSTRIGEVPYVRYTQKRSGTVRYEYAIKPGQFARYLIEITAFDCEKTGFEGLVDRKALPVGWPENE